MLLAVLLAPVDGVVQAFRELYFKCAAASENRPAFRSRIIGVNSSVFRHFNRTEERFRKLSLPGDIPAYMQFGQLAALPDIAGTQMNAVPLEQRGQILQRFFFFTILLDNPPMKKARKKALAKNKRPNYDIFTLITFLLPSLMNRAV